MFGMAQRIQSLREDMKVTVADTRIELSEHIKSLGVTLDQHLTFDSYVGNVCKAAYFHIRGLRHIRSVMSRETANTVACAIVGSRLDYCNSLLAGISSKNLDRLQRVQNTLARLVTGTQRRERITLVLAELHWLPVRARITFKISTIVFKLQQNRHPSYLAELIQEHDSTRRLRSATQSLLIESDYRLKIGQRSFRCVATNTWNNLPDSLKLVNTLETFRKQLKSYLYDLSYNAELFSPFPRPRIACYI